MIWLIVLFPRGISFSIISNISMLFFLFYTTSTIAQNQWTKTYGGDEIDAALCVTDEDGGYIFSGGTYSKGSGEQAWIVKTDVAGDTIWSKAFGGPGDERAYYIIKVEDGGYVSTGYITNLGTTGRDYFLLKLNASGDSVWMKTYHKNSIDWALCVQQTMDMGYVIVGFTQHQGDTDVWMIKTDEFGDTLWSKTYGGDLNDWGSSIKQTADTGFIITGFKEVNAQRNRDLWLLKTDMYGNEQWSKTFGGNEEDWGRAVIQSEDYGYVLSGVTSSFGAGLEDIWVLKTDILGDTLWARTFGGEYDDWAYASIIETNEMDYLVAGGTESYGMGGTDAWLIKSNSDGDLLWSKTYGGNEFDIASYVIPTTDNGFLLAGSTLSYGSNSEDAWLIKTDSVGNTIFTDINEYNDGNFNDTEGSIEIYPNPASHFVNIRYLKLEYRKTLFIYDMFGRLMHETVVFSDLDESRVDISAYPDGIYVAVLRNEGKILEWEKFVVAKQ